MRLDPIEAVRQALDAKGKTPYWLAKQAGISQGHMTNLMSGHRKFTADTIDQVASVLPIDAGALKAAIGQERLAKMGLPTNDITTLEVEHTFDVRSSAETKQGPKAYLMEAEEEVEMPYGGRVGCGRRLELEQGAMLKVSPELAVKGDYCIHADGDSMTKARIMSGDLLFVRRVDEPKDGDVVVASFSYDGTTVKRYRTSQAPGQQGAAWLVTESLTEDAPPVLVDETVHIDGVVVYVQPAGFAL